MDRPIGQPWRALLRTLGIVVPLGAVAFLAGTIFGNGDVQAVGAIVVLSFFGAVKFFFFVLIPTLERVHSLRHRGPVRPEDRERRRREREAARTASAGSGGAT